MKTSATPMPGVVYYVDDDPDDRSFFEHALSQIGAEAIMFDSAEAMLLSLDNPPPHPSVIFMDLNMPIKNGFETLEEIRNNDAYRDVPIVVLSTSGAQQGVEKCFALGASLYLKKPSCFRMLRDSIEEILKIDWDAFRRDRGNFMCRQ